MPPNIIELGPPIFSMSFLFIKLPSAVKRTMGSTNQSKKLRMGEVCSTISLENAAPASYRRSVRLGSFIRPVR